jgi:hypothetical protein
MALRGRKAPSRCQLELTPFRDPVKRGMALERAHVRRKETEGDGAAFLANSGMRFEARRECKIQPITELGVPETEWLAADPRFSLAKDR